MAVDEQLERMEMDIDAELAQVREILFAQGYEPDVERHVAKMIRTAWSKGMMSALTDPEKYRQLLVTHGYRRPKRR